MTLTSNEDLESYQDDSDSDRDDDFSDSGMYFSFLKIGTHEMSHVTRKPVFRIFDQVRLELASASEATR